MFGVCKLGGNGFNPRPRTGGDVAPGEDPRLIAPCFNPRPRTGGDVGGGVQIAVSPTVSIHAPARGATR